MPKATQKPKKAIVTVKAVIKPVGKPKAMPVGKPKAMPIPPMPKGKASAPKGKKPPMAGPIMNAKADMAMDRAMDMAQDKKMMAAMMKKKGMGKKDMGY